MLAIISVRMMIPFTSIAIIINSHLYRGMDGLEEVEVARAPHAKHLSPCQSWPFMHL